MSDYLREDEWSVERSDLDGRDCELVPRKDGFLVMHDDYQRVLQRLADARRVLESVEFAVYDASDNCTICPVCLNHRKHFPSCPLAAALEGVERP